MRTFFFLFFTTITITSSAQDISKGIDSMRKQLNKDMASYDSTRKISESIITAYQKRNDSLALARTMTQNTNNLVSFLKERDRKQQQAMWTRLAFGILMLGVLIFGLVRKRKKKNVQ